jgi:hypothetical protein
MVWQAFEKGFSPVLNDHPPDIPKQALKIIVENNRQNNAFLALKLINY